jgi:hypothetical protein
LPRSVDMPHLHATMRWKGSLGFADDPRLRDLWVRSRCSAGEVLAAIVLPEQLELVVRDAASIEAKLRAVAERADLRGAHTTVARVPEAIALRQVLTAVLARPCEAQLVGDPLEWPWSTARDALGAVIDPWVSSSVLVEATGCSMRELFGPPLRRAPESDVPIASLREILRAAAAATRRPIAAVRRPGPTRRLFVALAHRHGWWMPRHLASICGIGRRTLYKQIERVPTAWLHAGAACLGDARLRAVVLASPEPHRAPANEITAEPDCSSP